MPSLATNAGKFLKVNAGATDVEWGVPTSTVSAVNSLVGALTIAAGSSGSSPFEIKRGWHWLLLTVACMKRNGLEILNFQHKMNYNRSTNFEYTTETIMFYTRC